MSLGELKEALIKLGKLDGATLVPFSFVIPPGMISALVQDSQMMNALHSGRIEILISANLPRSNIFPLDVKTRLDTQFGSASETGAIHERR